MRYYEIFSEAKTQSIDEMGLSQMVARADAQLSGTAERAIHNFVGVPHNAIAKGIKSGIMYHHQLEDAFSSNPSEEGLEIRQELQRAFAPIKEKLHQKFGNTIELYRHQSKIYQPSSTRNVLSWTSNPEVAQGFAGVKKVITPITDTEIKRIVDEYERNGKVKVGRYEFIRNNENPEYYDIYHDGQYVTDGDDLYQHWKDEQEYQLKQLAKQKEALGRIVKANIPIDAIIWITNRAGQDEFIVWNKPNTDWHIDYQGKKRGKEK